MELLIQGVKDLLVNGLSLLLLLGLTYYIVPKILSKKNDSEVDNFDQFVQDLDLFMRYALILHKAYKGKENQLKYALNDFKSFYEKYKGISPTESDERMLKNLLISLGVQHESTD